MIERALVVESNIQSRRKLAHDLSSFQIADSVIEAESVQDGLTRLEAQPFGVCLLGPELHSKTIQNFLTQGRMRSLSPHCAFIRIISSASREPEVDSLADATVTERYDAQSLRRTVEVAVDRVLPTLTQNSFSHQPTNRSESTLTLPEALRTLAIEMKGVSRALTNGTLQLNKNGEPTDATLTAIRRTLERAFPERNQLGELPIDVRGFLNLTLDLLKARVTGNDEEIAKRLQKLL